MATEIDGSSLMWSDIPLGDGETQRLYSRYRWSEEITSTLVNINPSTHAILDIWSNVSQQQSLDVCAQSTTCTDALLDSFTEQQEATIVSQMDLFMGEAWPADRNPFSDIYIADPAVDALDDMHDHFQFVVTDAALLVYDNNGELLTSAPLQDLTRAVSVSDSALTTAAYEDAQAIDPPPIAENPITLSVSLSPSQPTVVPFSLNVDASRSSSPFGALTFSHELTLANGTTERFSGEQISTDITVAGNHVWVVTAADDTGRSRVQGYMITALANEDTEPTYGGAGSCVTPEYAMTANTLNICEEAQDGGEYECDTLASSSITLISSPAPCSPQAQNNGDLLGVCTLLINEVRIFYYENPLRPNNTETFSEKQTRFSEYCRDNFAGDWTNQP